MQMMRLVVCGLLLAFFDISTALADGSRKPNIIFILADDLGYGDVGVTYQNSRDPSKPHFITPKIDAMAAEGTLLRQHYTGDFNWRSQRQGSGCIAISTRRKRIPAPSKWCAPRPAQLMRTKTRWRDSPTLR